MKLVSSIVAVCAMAALALSAAEIDGQWTIEMKRAAGKKQTAAKDVTVTMVLDLKANGSALTGTVKSGARRARTTPIKDGKIEGNKFSFVTVQKNRKGERTVAWSGTVEGSGLKGERKVENARRGRPFVAKKT